MISGPSHPLLPQVQAAGGTTVGRLFAAVAQLHPERIALDDGESRLTYAALDRRVNQLASWLTEKGLERGDRVALLSHNRMEYLEVELACAKLGVITAALNWRLAARELNHCIGLVDPKLLIAEAQFEDALGEEHAAAVPRLWLGDEYELALAGRVPELPDVALHPEDGMLIIFTSGTTGLPKGALISHRAMLSRALVYASELGASRDASYIAWPPMFHMAGSDFSHACLMRGGTVFPVDGYQPQRILSLLARHHIHYFPVIPGMIESLIAELEANPVELVGMDCIGAMADLVPRHQLARITELLGAPFLNTFGSTETGIPPGTGATIAVGEAPACLAKEQNNFCEIRLVDAQDQDVEDGETGELLIRGPTLFSGYWCNDEANREAFRDGWFHMGDAFRRLPDGRLEFVDRVKYMIKSGGENIYPAEIEQVVMADRRVHEAAVVRRADPRWGEVPVLFITRKDDSLTEEALVELCRASLAGYKMPKAVYFIGLDEFPRSASGKVERHKLEARLAES